MIILICILSTQISVSVATSKTQSKHHIQIETNISDSSNGHVKRRHTPDRIQHHMETQSSCKIDDSKLLTRSCPCGFLSQFVSLCADRHINHRGVTDAQEWVAHISTATSNVIYTPLPSWRATIQLLRKLHNHTRKK